MSDIPQIIGGFSVLVATIFTGWATVDNRRQKKDADAAAELADRQRWSPRVLRAVTILREAFARIPGAVEPPGIDELLVFPPPKPKHARDVITDDE